MDEENNDDNKDMDFEEDDDFKMDDENNNDNKDMDFEEDDDF